MPLELNGTTGVQGNSGAFVAGTSVASTSGTSIDFTSIPSWVKRITVMFNQISTNGSSALLLQIGSGSITSSGYYSTSWTDNSTGQSSSGLLLSATLSAASYTQSGIYVINLIGSNTWVGFGNTGYGNIAITGWSQAGNSPSLGGTLDRVRVTTVNGTDTFDAGLVNILYE